MSNFRYLIFSFLFLAMQTAFAKTAVSDLCDKSEKPLFACKKKEKTFTLCASNDLSKNSGYLKYKALKSGKIELEYPKGKIHPFGKFVYSPDTKGIGIYFKNDKFTYAVYSNAQGDLVTVDKGNEEVSRIYCDRISDEVDVSLTSTTELLKKAGLECPGSVEDCLKK